jgi:HEAT repeat protein
MKFARKYRFVLTAPLAWMAGCALGPITGSNAGNPVVSLEQPSVAEVLADGTASSADLDAGHELMTTGLRRSSEETEEGRGGFIQLAAGRRRQQMSMPMAMPTPQANPQDLSKMDLDDLLARQRMLNQQMQQTMYPGSIAQPQATTTPAVSSASAASSGGSRGPVAKAAPSASSADESASLAASPLADASAYPPFAMPTRRQQRQQRAKEREAEEKAAAEAEATSTPASAEAERIERAAILEAERVEAQAMREAEATERRLAAEADLAERLARAELELAERVAMAREERDRRIAMTRVEREERLALIGVDPAQLDSRPLDSAIDRVTTTPPEEVAEQSGITRFANFFRIRKDDEAADLPPVLPDSRDIEAMIARKNGTDVPPAAVDPSVDPAFTSAESLASSASRFPSMGSNLAETNVPRSDRIGASSGPENLHSSLLDLEDTGADEAWMGDDAVADSGTAEDWSLLGNLDEDSLLSETAAVPDSEPSFSFEQWSPEEGASVAAAPAADPFPLGANSTGDYSSPGGLYGDPIEDGSDSLAMATEDASLLELPEYAEPPVQEPVAQERVDNEPWLTQGTPRGFPTDAQPEPEAATTFDWSTDESAVEQPAESMLADATPIDVAQQDYAEPPVIRRTAYQQRSLVDQCGVLPDELRVLVQQLEIPEENVRKEVLADIAALGQRAAPALPAIRVLLDDSPMVATHAAWTIWQINGDDDAVERELLRIMQLGDPTVAQFAAYTMGTLGANALDVAPQLRSERERYSGATRIHIAEALTQIDAFDQGSVQVLVEGLDDEDPQVRWLAALAIGELHVRQAENVVPALIAALNDSDIEVRSAAALSLGAFGPAARSAVPALQDRASLDAPAVRESARTALACIQQ